MIWLIENIIEFLFNFLELVGNYGLYIDIGIYMWLMKELRNLFIVWYVLMFCLKVFFDEFSSLVGLFF